jgi:hypothetical protein
VIIDVPDESAFLDQGGTINVAGGAGRASPGSPGLFYVTPEPCGLVLLGTGAVALLGYATRRKGRTHT